MVYGKNDLKEAEEFRAGLHKEALEKVRRRYPYAQKVIDRFSVYDYLTEHWDYPGMWYTIVCIPGGFRCRNDFIDDMVKNTLEYYRKNS